jgi:hypothetical protein
MKCHRCGAWTDVLETRSRSSGLVARRTRECGNGHRTVTYEMPATTWKSAAWHIQRDLLRIKARVQRWEIETEALHELRRSGDTQAAVAARYGRSPQWLRKAVTNRRRLAASTHGANT